MAAIAILILEILGIVVHDEGGANRKDKEKRD